MNLNNPFSISLMPRQKDNSSSAKGNPDRDLRFMRMAMREAEEAARNGEIPVGAVIVSASGTILGKGRNMTEALNDATAHAEMLALTAATQAFGAKYLEGCTLYVTLEPCIMCAGAIGWCRPARLVYGASDPKKGFSSFYGINPLHPKTIVEKGLLASESETLLKDFFAKRR